jgi:hypothetical protein
MAAHMVFLTADKIGKEICDVLGLKHCSLLDIHIAKGEIVTVTARIYPEKEGMKQVPSILRKYKLVSTDIEETTCIGDEVADYHFAEGQRG